MIVMTNLRNRFRDETSFKARKTLLSGVSPRGLLCRFGTEETGAFSVFVLFMFLLMVMIGGMAVDVMRFETKRVHMQNTLDSAILAAADLDQKLDPELVVKDYFTKAGLNADDVSVSNNENLLGGVDLVGRRITADTHIDVNTFFMHMLDVNVLSSPVSGSAEENIQNVEISLVLDISGSMRWDASGNTPSSLTADNRINDLKDAVLEFSRSVLQVECDSAGLNCVQSPNTASTTINIIPYAGHVNPGPDLFEILGGNRWHSWSSCKEVTDTDFNDSDLPRGSGNQLPHFMRWTVDWNWMNWGWCPQDDASILVAENDYNNIENFITNIKLHDGTATHIGMKYGVALLNPSSRDEFQELNNRNIVADAYKDRPADFEDDVVKYLVLMTDGKTTSQLRPSELNSSGEYASVYDPSDSDWDDLMDRYGSVDSEGDTQTASDVEWGYPSTSTYSDGSVSHNESRNNGHITAMCNEAKEAVWGAAPDGSPMKLKEHRITVFTIAFLAPTSASNLMRDCASSNAHFFPIEDLNVESAFQAIAKTINQLRLTL